MNNIMAWLLVSAILILPVAVAAEGNGFFLGFHAESTEGDDNSMTTYSYLKEPRVTETGYTRGLKSGSFNYLNKGDNIVFDESMHLAYGNSTNISNSTLGHSLNLSFDAGDEGNGISEFYGAGLFPNNRGLSAWKKIRYEKSRWLKTKDGKLLRDYDANNIWVLASVDMTTRETSEYLFSYSAGAKDAVIHAKDATGWSNRTGSRRLDSEYEAFMTGNFTFTNILQEIMPPAGELSGDWLPCCYNSTLPTLRQPGNPWPASVIIKTLQEYNTEPKIKVPCTNSTKCGELKFNETTKKWETSSNLKNCTEKFVDCPTAGCPGFECIKTFNEPEYDYYPETIASQKKLNDIQFTYSYGTNKKLLPEIPANKSWIDFEGDGELDAANEVIYELLLKNIGRTTLNNITITGTLPEDTIANLSYEAKVSDNGESRSVSLIDLVWDSTKRSFTYKLDSLEVGTRRSIHLRVFMKDSSKVDQIDFSVTGNSLDGSEVKDKASWLPAFDIDLVLFKKQALEKALVKKGLPLPAAEDYEPEIIRGLYQVDNNTIYSVDVRNTADKTLANLKMEIKTENATLAEPWLSYEVVVVNNNVQDVIKKQTLDRNANQFEWDELRPNDEKLIHFIVNNSTEIDTEDFSLGLITTRTDGSIFTSTRREIQEYTDINIIKEAYIKAKAKFKL